ncbi:MAG: hypothetical protein R2787_07690 [Saprospiraceae bacterium]
MKHLLVFFLVCGFVSTWAQDESSKAPISLTGGLHLGGQLYTVSGIPARSVSPLWNLSGSATLSLYSIQAPFSFTIGRQGRQTNVPSFSQFGISPTWKGMTLHAGNRSMRLSSYTLAGHPFLGVGIEGAAGEFRFAAMYGRLRRAREYVQDDPVAYPPVLQRKGYAIKMGVGTERTFIDLIYFHAADDTRIQAIPDSILTAAENTVVSLNSRLAMSKSFSLFAEAAISLYTRDVRSIPVTDEFPLGSERLFTPRWSSRANYATRAGMELRLRTFGIKGMWERVMPEFQTMGAFFFANDIDNITLSPTLRLWSSKIMINGTFGLQRNNLLDNRTETTTRFIGRGNILIRPNNRFSLNMSAISLAINQRDGNIQLTDTIRTALVTTHYSLSPMWVWSDSVRSRSFMCSVNVQDLNDRNPFTREFTDMSTWFIQATWASRPIRAGWGWSAGLTANRIFLADLTTDRLGGQGNVQRQFGKQWSVQGGGGWHLSSIDGNQDGSVTTLRMDARCRLFGQTSLTINTSLLLNKSRTFQDYSEWQGGIFLQHMF